MDGYSICTMQFPVPLGRQQTDRLVMINCVASHADPGLHYFANTKKFSLCSHGMAQITSLSLQFCFQLDKYYVPVLTE